MAPPAKIDVASSLAPFVMVFDDAGNVLASSGLLNGQNPPLPPGVLDFTRSHGEDRVTWTPEAGVRIAAVVVRSEGSKPGFVLAGRSLREAEKRVDQTTLRVTAALLATLFASLIMVALVELLFHRKTPGLNRSFPTTFIRMGERHGCRRRPHRRAIRGRKP